VIDSCHGLKLVMGHGSTNVLGIGRGIKGGRQRVNYRWGV